MGFECYVRERLAPKATTYCTSVTFQNLGTFYARVIYRVPYGNVGVPTRLEDIVGMYCNLGERGEVGRGGEGGERGREGGAEGDLTHQDDLLNLFGGTPVKHSCGIVLLHIHVHVLDLFISRNEQRVMSAGEIGGKGRAERYTFYFCRGICHMMMDKPVGSLLEMCPTLNLAKMSRTVT